VVEIRDDAPGDRTVQAALDVDDVLGTYPGLRRSRPLVESLHGLVDVEPEALPGCRFRLSLPRSTESTHAVMMRVGRHEIAVAAAAVESVHDAVAVHAAWDAAGAFVEVEGARVPVLHLAFLLGDVAYDELRREHVVIVGSCERRAALFASDARRTAIGRLMVEAQGLWAGTLETRSGVVPMMHVGAVLGRCTPADFEIAPRRRVDATGAEARPGAVLVVASTASAREQIERGLAGAGFLVRLAPSAEEAWRVLETETVDLLLCDLRPPEMHAQQITDRRRQTARHRSVPMVLVLHNPSEQSDLVVQQLGAAGWVKSPVEREALVHAVRRHGVRSS
jgi:CheY-like chemotaxis protein